jgi:hypothetical protein
MMSITVNMAPELEKRLRVEAAKVGLDPGTYIVYTLEERLAVQEEVPRLSKAETDLLQNINLGLSQENWVRYHELKAKRDDETLTSEEQSELIALADEIERANVKRVKYLVELSRLRNVPLEKLMSDLGIQTPPYV